ncbi:alpha/beta hydrolase family protein [Chitinophaga sp. 30R24]|uniref:alpha/beta hydrolase family protein n=1 Tax=Chitinophaga sp. 30R24 TaxID=3248838 RepID=UPI003B9171BA
MLQLSSDHTFHYELLRVLGASRANGADVSEVLSVAEKVKPGDFESWYEEFNKLAQHVHTNVPDVRYRVSARNALFRAASYYRSADFFLHGNPADPRIMDIWKLQTACFDQAISLMDIPGERFELATPEFNVPGIFYRAANDDQPRPTLLLCNGYDGSQEEMLHVFGFGALERGYNVITFEGPGQPTVVRNQQKGFITEWEKVVTPVVDYCQGIDAIDSSKLILLGYSFGGFLVPRAAAFEHRLAAVVCVDGLFDIYHAFSRNLPPVLLQFRDENKQEMFDQVVLQMMKEHTGLRWAIDQGCWAFITASPLDFLEKTRSMTMEGVVDHIQCPVLVCEAGTDQFFGGQPVRLANALGDRATYRILTEEDAAQEHCHVGATDFATSVVMDWVAEKMA